jgi:hypothetical protein
VAQNDLSAEGREGERDLLGHGAVVGRRVADESTRSGLADDLQIREEDDRK